MTCAVYSDRKLALVMTPIFLCVVGVFVWMNVMLVRVPILTGVSLGFAGLMVVLCLGNGFRLTRGPYYRVDEDGVHDCQRNQIIPWEDVVAVERAPRYEMNVNDENVHHLREGWRPVILTVREPLKYLRGFEKMRYVGTPPDQQPENAPIRLVFDGLQPLSETFYHCVLHHMAERDRRQGWVGASKT